MSLYDAPSGDFTPFVKYNAKAGRYYVKKETGEEEVQNPVFVADFANVKKAWMHFQEGQAPSVEYFPSLDANLAQPSPNHKLGISVRLFSNDSFGGVVKLESNSINTCSAIKELYDVYEAAPESKAGQLPVVKAAGVEPVKGQFGTNFKPKFEIVKWVDRPAAFDEGEEVAQSAPVQPAPAQQAPANNAAVSEF